jgi:VWFA-related protein
MTASIALLDKAFASLALRGDHRRCLDAVAEAANQLEAAAAERRKVILIIAQPSDVGSAAHLPDILTRLEHDNITVYQLVMPLAGLDLMEKTVAITKIHGVPVGNGTGIMGSIDLGTLVPEIMRGTKTASGQDELVLLANDLGGNRIPFRKQRDLESGISAIGRELHTGYILSYTPDSADPGYHRIRVETTEPGMTVRARPGYYEQ